MGLVACQVAYEKGQVRLDELRVYLKFNIEYVNSFLKKNIPKREMIYPERTYLVWLDFNKMNLTDDEIEELMLKKAKLWLDNGKFFGKAGSDFSKIKYCFTSKKIRMGNPAIRKNI